VEEHNKNLKTYIDASKQSQRWVGDKIVKIRERKEAWFINHSIELADLAEVSAAHVLFDLLEIFRKFSGLTINFTKTKGMCMWIGSSRSKKKKTFLVLNGQDSQLRPLGSCILMIKSCCLKRTSLKI